MTDFEEFFAAYIEAALWSSMDDSRVDGGDPMDMNYDGGDIDAETLMAMRTDCEHFYDWARDMIDGEPNKDYVQAGHDFWLTRNSHGAGFWDGDWPVNGDALDALAHELGEYSLLVGDDSLIYGVPGG